MPDRDVPATPAGRATNTGWTTPADIRRQLTRLWDRGDLLRARIPAGADRETSLFPLALRLRCPDARELTERYDEVRRWIRALEEGSRTGHEFGYAIEWIEINHRQLGRNRVPAGITIPTERDALRLIGRVRDAERFDSLAHATLARFPMLRDWLARRPLVVLAHAPDWERILAVLAWFRDHPRPACYLRQVDIPNVDTKFMESRKGLLVDLLDRVLPAGAVDHRFGGSRGFEQRYGFICKPALVRFRYLDARLSPDGLSDLTVPAAEFARLSPAVERVFVTENETNGLAFPAVPGGMVIFGLGYGIDVLGEARWLAVPPLHYWGDIDTHGFAMLDRLRAAFPEAQSFLMDRETLEAHRGLWGREEVRHEGPLTRLTPAEQALFDELRHDILGERLRLEQERIAFGWVERGIGRLDGR